MSEDDIKLKPCPFCGSSGMIRKDSEGFYPTCSGDNKDAALYCPLQIMDLVDGIGAYASPESAARDWNTRIPKIENS